MRFWKVFRVMGDVMLLNAMWQGMDEFAGMREKLQAAVRKDPELAAFCDILDRIGRAL